MQQVTQALAEVKDLFQKVVGQPAPRIAPHEYGAFPAGVDPAEHTVREVEYLKNMWRQFQDARTPPMWIPRADSHLTEDAFVLEVEVPGVRREDLTVSILGGECLVRGERKRDAQTTWRPLALECPWGAFERRYPLPAGCKTEKVTARHRDGVLEIRVPVDPVLMPKESRVEIA